MKEGLRSKILAFVLPMMMVLAFFVPGLKANAAEAVEAKKSEQAAGKYRIELNISHIDTRVNEKDDIKANARQVKYFKLDSKKYEGKDYLEIAKRLHDLPMAEVEKEFGPGVLSEKSKIFYEEKLVDRLKPNLYDKERTFEKIVIDNLEEGLYLIKETDESKKAYDQKLVTTIEKLDAKSAAEGILIVNLKKTVKNPKTTITLRKVDKNDKNIKLDKVEFYLYKKEGDKDLAVSAEGKNGSYLYKATGTTPSTLTTWGGGEIIVENLPEGEYFFEEKTPAPGYDKTNIGAKSAIVKPSGLVTVENSRTPTLKKIDENKSKYLQNAVFNLYKKDKTLLKFKENNKGYVLDEKGKADLVTNADGYIYLLDLADGEYYFKETKAPDKYILDEKEHHFKIKNGLVDNKDKFLLVTNKPEKPEKPVEKKGGHNFVKTDDTKDAKRLAGAVFKVQKVVDGKYTDVIRDGKIYTVTSSIDGSFYVDGLPYEGDGTKYALRETKAPDGYVQTSSVIEFTIDGVSKQNPAVFIKNKKNDIPPVPPTYNPPTTTYTPPDVPKIVRGPLVKTGDIKIIIMAIVGVLMIIVGKRLVVKSDRKLRAGIK